MNCPAGPSSPEQQSERLRRQPGASPCVVSHGKLPESPNSRALKGGANNASSGHVSSCPVVGEHWPHTSPEESKKLVMCLNN